MSNPVFASTDRSLSLDTVGLKLSTFCFCKYFDLEHFARLVTKCVVQSSKI